MSDNPQAKGAGAAIKKYISDFKVLKETRSEYWGIQVINVLDCTIFFAMLTISSVFLSKTLGVSDIHAGYIITVFTTATTLFLMISGVVTDWLGIRKSLYVAIGALVLLRVGIVIVGLPELTQGQDWVTGIKDSGLTESLQNIAPGLPLRGWAVGLLFFLMAPFMALIQTSFQAANKRFTTKKSRSAGFSLWYLFMNIGAFFGGLLIDFVGLLLKIPVTHIFSIGVVLGLLCLVAMAFMVRREEQLFSNDEEKEADEAETLKEEKKSPLQIAKAVLSESAFWKLACVIGLLLGVRAVFAYFYLVMPKYWLRTIGEDAAYGTLNAINPALIVIGIILFIPFSNRWNIFSMLTYGAMISAVSLFFLTLPWTWFSGNIATAHYIMAILFLVVLSVGELIWSPKLSEYTAAVAPKGQEGSYLGFTMIPWFLAKTVVSILSGHMLLKWSPEGIGDKMVAGTATYWETPAAMWLVLGVVAVAGCLLCMAFKPWLTKGARWKIGEDTTTA